MRSVHIGIMVRKSREVMMLPKREEDVCCVHKLQYKETGCRMIGDNSLFWEAANLCNGSLPKVIELKEKKLIVPEGRIHLEGVPPLSSENHSGSP